MLIDTFPAFLEFWTRVQHDPLDVQIERWAGDLRPFLGSWYEIEGHSQCGYFLSEEAIKALEARMSLREIGLFGDPERYLSPVLEQFARFGPT